MNPKYIGIITFALITALCIPEARALSSENNRKSPVCKNYYFNFTVIRPDGYKTNEFPEEGTKEGFELKRGPVIITVRAMPSGTDYSSIPFDDYVRIAASSEIQNYSALSTIEPFTSITGVKGYKTRWHVNEIKYSSDPKNIRVKDIISSPIYYFPASVQRTIYGQPVKTIMISSYSSSADADPAEYDAEAVAKSFAYYR